jgi:drug/metabolite transporter (DMT)-like permease
VSAAVIQLSVPAIAALGGVLLLAEPLSSRLVIASATIMGGIALTILRRRT